MRRKREKMRRKLLFFGTRNKWKMLAGVLLVLSVIVGLLAFGQIPVQADSTTTLTVNFPGISTVHTYVKVDDGVKETANGTLVASQLYKNDQAVFSSLPTGTYDVVVVKGAKTLIKDAVVCTNDTALVKDIVCTLTIQFPDLTSVHAYVKVNDTILQSATGGAVEERTYQTNTTSMVVLRNHYDVKIVIGSNSYIYDNVDCTGATCTLDKSTLTVKFPGISSVHTYVRASDGTTGKATGTLVASQTYKTDQAVFDNLSNGKYDVVVVKGAKTKIIDDVICIGDWAAVDDIVCTLTVEFPGISSVHTYVKVDDTILKSATGGAVEERTYKTNTATMVVLKNIYDVVVVKGAKTLIKDAVVCTNDTALVKDIVCTLTVEFPGISSVHTYVKVPVTGGAVEERTYKTNTATMVVLKNTYDVVVVKGAKTKIITGVNCEDNAALVKDIVCTLTVNFPGSNGVHVYVKVDDNLPNSATKGDVDNRTYQNNSTTLAVLKNTYDIVVVSGGVTTIYDAINCYGNTCEKSLTTIKLLNSLGGGLANGVVNYYDGSWHPLGKTDATGILRAAVDGSPRNLLFGITHQYVYNEKWQNIATNPLVQFQTKNVVISLKDSVGNLIPDTGGTGAVRYYTGAWHDFASGTTSGGQASMELLPANILFSITHQFVYNEKWQNTTGDANVLFQTKNVVISLKDSVGNLIPDTGGTGAVRYYTGAWHDLGTTSGGQVNMELLPANILFGITHQFVYNEKWQNTGTVGSTVVFQTGQVTSASNTCTQYYTGSWHPFTNNMELLSASILFHFNDGTGDTWFTPVAGTVNNIH